MDADTIRRLFLLILGLTYIGLGIFMFIKKVTPLALGRNPVCGICTVWCLSGVQGPDEKVNTTRYTCIEGLISLTGNQTFLVNSRVFKEI